MKNIRPVLIVVGILFASLVFAITPSIVAAMPPLQRLAAIIFFVIIINAVTGRRE